MTKELNDVTRKSGIVLAGQVFGYFCNFVYAFIVVKMLGPAQYGRFIYVYALIDFLSILCKIGLDNGFMYMIPKLDVEGKTKERNSLISITLLASFFLSLLTTIVIILFSRFFAVKVFNNQQLVMPIIYIAPLLIPLVFTNVSKGILRGIHDIKHFIIGDYIIQSCIRIATVFAAILLGSRFEAMIIAFYASFVIESLYFLFRFRQKKLFGGVNLQSIGLLKDIFIFSYPLVLTGVISFIMHKTDTFIIGYMMNEKQVGIYNIALSIGNVSSFMLTALNMSFAPVISMLFHKGDMENLEHIYKITTKWIVAINLLVFSMILLFNREIMLIFGKEIVAGSLVLVLIAIGQVVNVGVGSAGFMLTMTGKPKVSLYLSILVLIINVVLNILLIPRFGINGAAVATLTSLAVINLLRLLIVYKDLHMHPYNLHYLSVMGSAGVTTIIVFLVKSMVHLYWLVEFIVLGSILVILYAFFYILSAEPYEKKYVKKTLTRFFPLKITKGRLS